MSRSKEDYEDHLIRMEGFEEWLEQSRSEITSEELDAEFERQKNIVNRKRGS